MRRIVTLWLCLLAGGFVLSLAWPAPVQAQVTQWAATFYPQNNLSGAPTVTANYTSVQSGALTTLALDFDTVGLTGRPATFPQTDNFSAQFTTNVNFAAGTYRFTLSANQRGVLRIGNPGATPRLDITNGQITVDVPFLTAGPQQLILEYYEDTGAATVNLNWQLIASGGPTAVPTAGPSPTPVPGGGGGSTAPGTWQAQYFPNFSFTGTPITATVASPSADWGLGSPAGGIPADNFSARFTTIAPFTAGVYRFEVRADDGVRLTVAGLRAIDHWYPSDGSATHVANVYVNGPSSLTLEYYEATGGAFLFYNAVRVPDGTPTSVSLAIANPFPPPVDNTVVQVSAIGQVTAGTLNVRNQPGTGGQVLTKINFGQFYPVIASNSDRSWYLIRVGIIEGWVSARFLRISNETASPVIPPVNLPAPIAPPVIVPTAVPPVVAPGSTGLFLTVTENLIIRSQPNTQSTQRGLIAAGQSAEILGRNSSGTWWYVTQNLQIGWISGRYVVLPAGLDVNRVPVTAR